MHWVLKKVWNTRRLLNCRSFVSDFFLEREGMSEKLECSECTYIAPRIERPRSHIRVKHLGLRVACQLCPFTATESPNLNRHIESVHDNVRYECEHCQKVYKEKGQLKKHIDYEHKNKERKKYTCVECHKTYMTKFSLTLYTNVHQGVSFSCDKCAYTTSFKSLHFPHWVPGFISRLVSGNRGTNSCCDPKDPRGKRVSKSGRWSCWSCRPRETQSCRHTTSLHVGGRSLCQRARLKFWAWKHFFSSSI